LGIKGTPLRPLSEGASSLDLLSFFIPRSSIMIGGATFLRVTRALQCNTSEDGGYLTPTLLIAALLALWHGRGDKLTRVLLLFALVVEICALVARLHVHGTTYFPLPWILMTKVPLLDNALPQRFSVYAWLALALVITRWLVPTTRPRTPAVTSAPEA